MFDNYLRKLRIKNGYSQEQVAEKLLTTQLQISKYEAEIEEPDLDTLKKLGELYGEDLSWMIVTEDEMRNPGNIHINGWLKMNEEERTKTLRQVLMFVKKKGINDKEQF